MAGIDSYTVSCLHFQNRVWTFAGNAHVDTAQSKFGSASLCVDESGPDYISSPNSSDFNISSGDWTIDCWIYRTSTSDYWDTICGRMGGGEGRTGYYFMVRNDNKLCFCTNYNNSSIVSSATIALDTWYHVAAVSYGGTIKLYIDGTNDGSGSLTPENCETSSMIS